MKDNLITLRDHIIGFIGDRLGIEVDYITDCFNAEIEKVEVET